MAAIKGIEVSSGKWVRRAAVAGPDYQSGVENPRVPWDQAAAAAAGSYTQGVTAAAQAGRYAAGVRRVGMEKYRRNAVAKGPGRFAEGVSLAQGDWMTAFQPYQQAIAGLNLPPRGPKGSAGNLQRVTAVSQRLRQLKEQGSGNR